MYTQRWRALQRTDGRPHVLQSLDELKQKVEVVEIYSWTWHIRSSKKKISKTTRCTRNIMRYPNPPKINQALEQNKRIIAVGTTSVRVLESVVDKSGRVKSCSGETDIFIYPPYNFKVVKGLITNFHLPESTLIMLVSAFLSREKVLELYKLAIEENYRFFSFGDAMLIL